MRMMPMLNTPAILAAAAEEDAAVDRQLEASLRVEEAEEAFKRTRGGATEKKALTAARDALRDAQLLLEGAEEARLKAVDAHERDLRAAAVAEYNALDVTTSAEAELAELAPLIERAARARRDCEAALIAIEEVRLRFTAAREHHTELAERAGLQRCSTIRVAARAIVLEVIGTTGLGMRLAPTITDLNVAKPHSGSESFVDWLTPRAVTLRPMPRGIGKSVDSGAMKLGFLHMDVTAGGLEYAGPEPYRPLSPTELVYAQTIAAKVRGTDTEAAASAAE